MFCQISRSDIAIAPIVARPAQDQCRPSPTKAPHCLGNGPASSDAMAALQQALASAEPMVAEHIEWALATLAVRQEKEDKKTRLLIRCIEKGLPDHA